MSRKLDLRRKKYRGVGQGVDFYSEYWSHIKESSFDMSKTVENHSNFLGEKID